ncbi:MAG TPA: DUF2325 domain-containing protein [Polyangiaceae bacterium]|jgi:hypothetical protein
MKIALVGGLVRREAQLAKLAEEAGHELEWHTGDVSGRGADSLKAVIERADAVLILSEINCHGSMYLAKRVARQLGRNVVVLRKCGPAKFQTVLAHLEAYGSLRGLERCA